MEPAALLDCLTSLSCVVTQTTSGLIIGMLFFLVAAGLTLIFGVLGIVNFAHGAFYMVGAYLAYSAYQVTGSYLVAVLAGGFGAAILGVLFERFAIRRVYGENVLLQLLVCYGFVLVADDLVQIIWGSEYLSMGMPQAFRLPPVFIAGGIVPPFYIFIITVAAVFAAVLWFIIERTQYGRIIRATAVNPTMVSALGIPTPLIYLSVFALGMFLAGMAGGLAAPIRALTPGMGFSVLIVSFVVTVIGGMGSVTGALVASILIGLVRSYGSIGFPLFVDGLMYVMMGLVLVLKPNGLLGRQEASRP
ncbi:ABC transporter permease [Actibacterium mucosum KCTC 23349]|uniref:ABC transporter permease n=1 Tax=Actibacterium mucosum KCTC 23349 TaxID=1454373 RepID=A0A037ZHX5_9RHOB|nr:branched-chain amino acid ABC transporter permease [Actibacterium mucosum]KAJ54385.1 ABC transporter permease [Actibacterium mucosum KCTC 23349]